MKAEDIQDEAQYIDSNKPTMHQSKVPSQQSMRAARVPEKESSSAQKPIV
jgi:hypothetical protein